MAGSFHRMAAHLIKLLGGAEECPENAPPVALIVGESAKLGFIERDGLAQAASLEAALQHLAWTAIPVVLCDSHQCDGDWKTAIRLLSRTACRPCVVLLTEGDPLQHWEDVSAAGGYDVMRKPATPQALDRVIRSATAYWRCRRALDSG
jgi:DNA-binding NarL/FixJ family response regulator